MPSMELPMKPTSSAKSNRRKGSADSTNRRLVKDPVRYKTMLCQNWQRHGCCPYGFKCQFAHGADELRARSDGQKADTTADAPPRRGKDAVEDAQDAEVTPPLAPAIAPMPGASAVPPLRLSSPAMAPSAALGEMRLDWAPPVAQGFANAFALPPPVSPRSSASSLVSHASHADSPYHPPLVAKLWPSAWPSEDARLSGASGASDPSLFAESERESERRESEADADSLDDVGEMLRCNARTGAVEIAMPPGVDKQASHHTVSVRRQISQLFEEEPLPLSPPKTPKHKFWFSDGVWSAGASALPRGISLF